MLAIVKGRNPWGVPPKLSVARRVPAILNAGILVLSLSPAVKDLDHSCAIERSEGSVQFCSVAHRTSQRMVLRGGELIGPLPITLS
jgi:hypothetical protein